MRGPFPETLLETLILHTLTPGGLAAALIATTALAAPAAAQQPQPGEMLPYIDVTASRLFDNSITGASTTVITADDIARAPSASLQEIIAQVPGVQLHSLYGGVNGAGTVVDLRGFGAFATANTLVLVNGRRINDLDLAGVDFAAIPRESIERIEVTRGNSGAVLYGDNAVGGVINIVTKTGASGGKPLSMRAEGGVGSFNQQQGSVSLLANSGPWSSSLFANGVKSDGYRANNAYSQRNAVGEVRYSGLDFSAFFNISADDQRLRLPGGRSTAYTVDYVTYVDQLATDRRGTSTPHDYADKQGVNVTAGFTYRLWDGADLIVDGGVRSKDQQAGYFGDPADIFAVPSYVDARLRTWSLTPRLDIRNDMFGLRSRILAGLDYYDATYASKRSQLIGDPPNHVYDLSQRTFAAYWQQTLGLTPDTDFSYGTRVQHMSLDARDRFDPSAPSGSLGAEAAPLNMNETNYALHLGLEHRFNRNVAVFARAAHAFRTPNVDERVVTGPAWNCSSFPCLPIPQDFALKTQTSHDFEGGVRISAGAFSMQTSLYYMELTNEIHFNPVDMFNYNLDPTRRYGSETRASFRINDAFLLRGSLAYTRAQFRDGPFAGNDVPLVSRWSGSAGFSWNVWQRYLVFDADARFWGDRRMDNDQGNTEQVIPANATLDLKIGGEVENFFWSFSVNNVFDTLYYDYAIASAYTPGVFSAYPLPGRTYLLKAGFKL